MRRGLARCCVKTILKGHEIHGKHTQPATEYDSEETKAAREKADRLEDLFLETLQAEQRGAYEQFRDAQLEEEYLYNIDRLILGYRLGVLMTMEVFTDRERLTIHGEGH